jgi:hypothetical protein
MDEKLFAVTMPLIRVYSGLAKKLNIYTYTHTINSDKYLYPTQLHMIPFLYEQ